MLRHKEKFVVCWRELLADGSKQPRSLCDDAAWQELLLLPVNGAWLRKSLGALDATKLNQTVLLRMQMMPLSHGLLARLIGSLRIGGDTNAVDKLRQKHALETLGVLVYALLDRQYIDFKQQVLSLFCVMEDANRFFARLFGELKMLLGVNGVHGPGENGQAKESKENDALRLYICLLSLYLLLTLATACDNLERNPIMDHFSVQSAELMALFDSVLKADRPLSQKEQAFALISLVCNHRKHESRNPFRARFRGAEINDMHLYIFSLRDCTAGVNALLARCTKTQASRGSLLGADGSFSQEALAEMVESASDSVIAWGAQMGSAFGAWVSGIDAKKGQEKAEREASKKGLSAGKGHLPLLSVDASGVKVFLDAALWLRARFLLLSTYELLCGTGGERWIKVLTEHDVPPWAHAGGMRGPGGINPQPLECSQAFLEVIKLASFCFHSNAQKDGHPSLSAHMALFVVRCLAEHPQAETLLFTVRLEETANVESLEVFERDQNRRDGKLLCLKAKEASSRVQSRAKPSEGDATTESDARMRMRSQSANMMLLSQSLASTLIRQLSILLIEHTSEKLYDNCLNGGETTSTTTPSPHLSQQEQQQLSQTQTQHQGAAAARRDSRRPGLLCSRIIECLHRLLLFEKRTQNRDTSSLQGVEWRLVTRALFSLMSALSVSPGAVLVDLDRSRHMDLCAHLVHVFNLILSTDSLGDLERFTFIYEILSHRTTIEAFGRSIDQAAGPAKSIPNNKKGLSPPASDSDTSSARLVQQSMSNLRTILFHFSQTVMMMESVTAKASAGASAEDRAAVQQRTSHIMKKLAESAPTLKLRPHDRLMDGFQRFAETREERNLIREFISELCRDAKSLRLFSTSIKKNL